MLCRQLAAIACLIWQADADPAHPTVTVRVFVQVLLVLLFSIVKWPGGADLCADRAQVADLMHSLSKTGMAGLCGLHLLGRHGEQRRAILGADIVALTHPLRRIVVLPEQAQQIVIADKGGIKHHPYRFGVPGLTAAHFAIGWVGVRPPL